MDNRDKDQLHEQGTPTDAGRTNRTAEEAKGRDQSGTTAKLGQNIGRADNLEGGQMEHRKDKNPDKTKGNVTDSETTRRPDSDFGTSSGRSGSIGNTDVKTDLDRESGRRGNTGELGDTGKKSGSGEGRP